MKTLNYHILAFAAAALSLTACSDDSFGAHNSPEQDVPILLGACYQQLSRATDLGFDDGDNMGVYVVDYLDGAPRPLSALHADNVKYTYDVASDRWRGATNLYWTDKETHVDIYGYYPFSRTMTPGAGVHKVAADQSVPASSGVLSAYESSDLLWAAARDVAPTDQLISLTYTHAMAGVTIRLAEGEGFSEGEFADAAKLVWLEEMVTDCTVDLQTQTVSAGSVRSKIVPLAYGDVYRAVTVPQTVAAGRPIIGLTIDGTDYALTKTSDVSLTSGRMHTFTLRIDKKAPSGDFKVSIVDEAITPWVDDEQFHDGVVAEYVSVHVDVPGTLPQVVEEMGIDLAVVENLKVSGTVQQSDFSYIQEHQEVLARLNLIDVTIDDPDDEYDDAIGGLNYCRMLRYVFWPKKLKKLCDWAFYECPLVGSFILPEGLEYIGTHALTQAGTNGGCPDFPVGELYLPSTVKYIGWAAFHAGGFRGEIHLPDGLEYIGAAAFDHSHFTGQLVLPESLKEIGGGAFVGSHFTGDLEVPQGIKRLDHAFEGATFDGCLILHEGLEEIHRTFFRCGFRGELKMPSTLRSVTWAFIGNRFTRIIWSDNLVQLGDGVAGVFDSNDRLTGTIDVPRNISAIQPYTFRGCSLLTGIELHEDVEYVGERAFAYCSSLQTIVCHAKTPPVIKDNTFEGVNINNITVEVPAEAVALYRQDARWGKFARITAYRNFVTRPARLCALNTEHYEPLVLTADGPWHVSHLPQWCSISAMSGDKKTSLAVTIAQLPEGGESRTDYIEFALDGTENVTRVEVSQYDYQYQEDELVQFHAHTQGRGIKLMFVPDGWDAQSIASGAFLQQVTDDMEYFFGLPPYDRLRDFFDVYVAFALSQDCGVNTENTYVNNRFDTIYTYGDKVMGIPPCLMPDEELIFAYLRQYPEIDNEDLNRGLTILIPNTTDYPAITYYFEGYYDGWGLKTMSICPPTTDSFPHDMRGIIQHEAGGHGFAKLADECISHNAFISGNDKAEVQGRIGRGWYRNITLSGNMNAAPWSHMIFDPRYSDYVDMYEGGCGYTRGVFRPEANSCMNFGIPYYNAISRQTIVEAVYSAAGEWYSPERDFYPYDTRGWGSTSRSSAPSRSSASACSDEDLTPIPRHTAPLTLTPGTTRRFRR